LIIFCSWRDGKYWHYDSKTNNESDETYSTHGGDDYIYETLYGKYGRDKLGEMIKSHFSEITATI